MHVWFIMDGNRRWAAKSGILKTLGHTNGAERIEEILQLCIEAGIKTASFWALATENLKNRDMLELTHIFWLIRQKLPKMVDRMKQGGIRFVAIGDLGLLPQDIVQLLNKAETETAECNRLTFALAIWHGGRHEIVRWVQSFAQSLLSLPKDQWQTAIDTLDEPGFRTYVQSSQLPDLDLVIRTGWDVRHSWYMLYLSEYAEYHFTKTLWPDFGKADFDEAMRQYHATKRNHGK